MAATVVQNGNWHLVGGTGADILAWLSQYHLNQVKCFHGLTPPGAVAMSMIVWVEAE